MANVKGVVTEKDNQASIKNVRIMALDATTHAIIATTFTDTEGHFNFNLPEGQEYKIVAEKKSFFHQEMSLTSLNEINAIAISLERKPGYIFDVSLMDASHKRGKAKVDAIIGARIEIYNNTSHKEELVLMEHNQPSFIFNFEEGNHYTIMVRKKGYLTKRIEAYINVDDCILCFDGMGIVEPNVVEIMTHENQRGAFLSNLEMEPVAINTTFRIENLYYDYNESNIRPDAALVLDNVVQVLKDNPAIKIEMGSHTDARGTDHYNLILSEARAKSAVEYLVAQGIDANHLTWKGYGEKQLINSCKNGVECAEEMHQENRRTELKITGIEYEDPLDKKSLRQIIESERGYQDVSFSLK